MKSLISRSTLALLLLVGGVVAVITSPAMGQSQTVTDDNLDQAIANAKTPADHEAIAAYYDKEAAEDEAKAKLHENAVKEYKAFPSMKPVGMAAHCKNLAKLFKEAAEQDKELAAAHRAMAKAAGSPG